MMATAVAGVTRPAWQRLFPDGTLIVAVPAINLIGDGLGAVFDPRADLN
ncbi:hypothetical protein [Rhizobium sp. CF122]